MSPYADERGIVHRTLTALPVLPALVSAAFTFVTVSASIPSRPILLSYVVSQYGLYLLVVGALGVGLPALPYRKGAEEYTGGTAERLTACGTEAEVVPVPGADHIFLGAHDGEGIVARSVAFLARHLAADAAGHGG
ncbi:hypothetical protein [Streptomyces sp. CC208A]|uniref:hypothetical protein n=1 Tax=Streptomyces sp. CC208A TaxID=3044573 RepID=UPI0024A80D80|nr:hypothetical protein [Streptomyces sp. CC208A]